MAVFEVKTKCDRQSLHTAIGQLMTHGRQSGVTKHLVVPADGEIPNDCEEALELLAIKVRRFRAVGDAWQLYT